jgi:hypothetical protein
MKQWNYVTVEGYLGKGVLNAVKMLIPIAEEL